MLQNNYTLSEFIRNVLSVGYTKLFFPKARLIRRPFYIRGKKRVEYGEGLTTGYNCRIETFDFNKNNEIKLQIGENC